MLASVFWPGSFIRCVVNATAVAVAAAHLDTALGADVAKAIPTAAGLAAIPFIVKPIDGTIDTAMEMSVTKALNGKIEGVQDAGVAVATIAACLAVPPPSSPSPPPSRPSVPKHSSCFVDILYSNCSA